LGEEAREDGLDEGVKQDLGAICHGKSHPENEDEFEDVVEREPVDSIDCTLNDCEESIHDPVGEPLGIVHLARAEKCIQRVVSWDDEACEIHKELSTNIEENQEEVETDKAEEDIDLWNICLLLEIVEGRILGEFLVNLGDLVLSSVLERRHLDAGN